MGTCQVLMHRKLIEKISQSPYDVIIRILKMTEYGEDDLFFVEMETDVLSDGYHGQLAIVVNEDSVEFKKDLDT